MDFLEEIKRIQEKISSIETLYKSDNLEVSFDSLESPSSKVENEILYFKTDKVPEFEGMFVFGFDFFLKDLGEQEFKEILGLNSLNMKIYSAYHALAKENQKVKLTDMINLIQNKKKDSLDVNLIVGRILSLAYYLNWDLKRDKADIENDFELKMPNIYLSRLKKRFDFNMAYSLYEDDNLFIFLNCKSKLYVVFKDLNEFNQGHIENLLIPVIKEIFKLKNVEIQ